MSKELKIGDYIQVTTRTKDGTYGDCIYFIEGPTEEKEINNRKKELTKCVMLGGSGPSAVGGLVIWDNLEEMSVNVDSGVIRIIPENEAKKIVDVYNNKNSMKNSTGCMEADF
jgi:hypothetical protein